MYCNLIFWNINQLIFSVNDTVIMILIDIIIKTLLSYELLTPSSVVKENFLSFIIQKTFFLRWKSVAFNYVHLIMEEKRDFVPWRHLLEVLVFLETYLKCRQCQIKFFISEHFRNSKMEFYENISKYVYIIPCEYVITWSLK